MSLIFNNVLLNSGIDPTKVQLVRHQDNRFKARTPFHLWRNEHASFEEYQSLQSKERFSVGAFIASFVVPPSGETLFVGLYKVNSVGAAKPGHIDPLSRISLDSHFLYDLQFCQEGSEYISRLVVDWGSGFRSWIQRAHLQNQIILEIRKAYTDPAFPGYLRFRCVLSELQGLPLGWVERLREAHGVYLITCPKTKEWYVGSATGGGGFYERWSQHTEKGGDAVGFRFRDPADYQVTILEVAGSSSSSHDIVLTEHVWMEKLQTPAIGLNLRSPNLSSPTKAMMK